MSADSSPPGKRSRLSIASAVLAVIPLLALGLRLLVDPFVRGTGLAADIASSLLELSLLCVPLALPMGLAASWRHRSGPTRPGVALALLGTLLSGAELLLLIFIANAQF
ncbi:hypothetical protein SAMN02745121_07947 [Nannocystis exedens]|uniref:Uncharacterized protein n=1 Tax=Nannocystis exedens TaxID=54 RepID=A0A1I2HEJ6_9BACT|nr:hypothetical protein [Nannocystis exedens]PCC70386.1 hypothetical protein NAEX_03429 [Nannocystis exedens]SFF28685.1 hypothetical protein SAMN02745121_07947 [Nannocystis exedens]